MGKRKTVKAVVSAAGGLALFAGAVLSGSEGNAPVVPPDDGDGRKVLIDPKGFDATNPKWSPSCDKVVFEKCELPLYGDQWLCIYDIDEATFTDIDNTALFPHLYDWSPDGEWIAYQSYNNRGLYIIRPDGSENLVVYSGAMGSTGGSFSPDGEKLAYGSRDGLTVADISNLYDIEYEVLPGFEDEEDSGRWEGGPLWSPDGRYIARSRVYEDNFDFVILTRVYVIDPEAGDEGEWELLFEMGVEEGLFFRCDWSSDGRYLLLLLTLPSGYECFELCAYEVDTGVFTRITHSNEHSRIEGGNWGNNGEIVFEVLDYKKRKDNPDGPWHVIYTIDAPP
jgi:dipeptidyl aminopeptidase/acylaminoacyl peptidase